MCYVLCVKCHVSSVIFQMSQFYWGGGGAIDKVVKIFHGGSVINGATLSSLKGIYKVMAVFGQYYCSILTLL